jgi:hypothetical protein
MASRFINVWRWQKHNLDLTFTLERPLASALIGAHSHILTSLGSVWMFALGGLALHSVEYQCPRIFALRFNVNICVWMFSIWYLKLISKLNAKSCLDGQSDVLHLYESMIPV